MASPWPGFALVILNLYICQGTNSTPEFSTDTTKTSWLQWMMPFLLSCCDLPFFFSFFLCQLSELKQTNKKKKPSLFLCLSITLTLSVGHYWRYIIHHRAQTVSYFSCCFSQFFPIQHTLSSLYGSRIMFLKFVCYLYGSKYLLNQSLFIYI